MGNGGVASLQGRQTDRKPHFSTLYFNTLHCVVGEALVHFATLLCTGDIALGTECWEYPHLLVPPSLYPPSPSQICHTPIDNIFTPILSLFPHICANFLKRVWKESIFWTNLRLKNFMFCFIICCVSYAGQLLKLLSELKAF